jgi:primosomal protein N' (replication factor Y)
LVLAKLHNCKTILGTATPSIESFWNANRGKYALVTLDQRYGDANLPEIVLEDARPAKRAKVLRGEFTPHVFAEIKRVIDENQQVIVFQNRRGYAPYVHCNDCGWIPKCQNCAVSLTYHLYSNELKCHYCGHRESLPHNCIECHSSHIETMSFGTQKLQDDLGNLLPEAKVARVDYDSTRQKRSYEEIIKQIQDKEVDIIVGTQMISKGFDFDSIALVVILGADQIIHFPDFRAHERAYSLMTQVSGRTGRRSERGLVYIQSSQHENFILQCIKKHNYQALYQKEIADRERFHYPPFFRLIKVIIKDESRQKAMEHSWLLHRELLTKFPSTTIAGPNPALIFRIRNKFQFEILIRIHRSRTNLHAWKRHLSHAIDHVNELQKPKSSRIIVDVDPY